MTAQPAFHHLLLAHLAPSPTNPRKTFVEADLIDLGYSIVEQGVMQPILVRLWPEDYPTPEGRAERPLYEIVAGERRYRASLLAELAEIPALVRPLTTRQVLEMQIVENLQRRDVSELEEAEGYDRMMREHGYSADELAEKVGKSKAYIYARLKLTALGPAAREAYRAGKMSASVALLVARIPGAALQEKATKEIVDGSYPYGSGEPMSARQAAQHVQNRYMLRLADAPFPRADADLVPGAGKCHPCPKRTGSNPDLFPDVKSADVCTDPDCFAAKKEAAAERRVAEAKATGLPVIAGADADKVAPYGIYNLKGFVKLDAPNYDAPRRQEADIEPGDDEDEGDDNDRTLPYLTYRECLGTTPVQVTLIEDCQNKTFVECVETGALRAALEAAGRPMPPTQQERNKDLTTAIKQETEFRRHVFNQIREAQRNNLSGTDGFPTEFELRLVARQFWARLWNESQKKLARLYVEAEEKLPDYDRIKQLDQLLDTFDVPQVVSFMVDCALVGTLDVSPHSTPKTPEILLDAATNYALDPAALRKQLKTEKAKPKATAKGKSKASETASTPTQAAPARDLTAQTLSIGDRVRIRAGACWDNGEPIGALEEAGTITSAVADGFSVSFEGAGNRTYLPAHALERVEKIASPATQAAPAADNSALEKRRAELAAKGIKYCHPSNLSITHTWSGRGRKPLWVADWLEGGGTLEELSTASQAAPAAAATPEKAPEPKGNGQAAAAAKTTKAKAGSSSRASAAERKEKTSSSSDTEAMIERCTKTLDLLEATFPELKAGADQEARA